MKTYFAKWLPVDKMDKSNYWQWYNNVQNTGWEYITPSDMDAVIAHGLQPVPEFRKVKLFLVSRDIQVGDKVWSEDKGYYIAEQMLVNINTNAAVSFVYPPIKVIGEISPEANWVKENDEFNEDELDGYFYEYGDNENLFHFYVKDYKTFVDEKRGYILIKIECSQCNTFH